MSKMILATNLRDNALMNQNMPIQLDFATDMEQHGYGGIIPYYRYLGIVHGVYDIKQNDYLLDQLTTDQVTGAQETYVVVNKPEPFPDGHMEIKCDDARVTGFS